MRRKIFIDIAHQLEQRLKDDPAFELPAIDLLARDFHIAKKTMWKAVRLLSERGILISRPNARIQRAAAVREAGLSSSRSSARFYNDLNAKIREGTYRPGELLPKFSHFAGEYHVARDTIVHAINRLSNDHLVHKEGRRWVIGPRPVDAASSASRTASELGPIALLLCTDVGQNVFHSMLVQPFWENLESHLREKGTQLHLGYRIAEKERSAIPCQGPDEVMRSLRMWGDFYRGAVIFDQHAEAEVMSEWSVRLSCSGSRPVAFFDLSDSREIFTRSELSMGDWYYRLHFDEPAAVELAIKHLAAAGHRIIGLPNMPWDANAWVKRRIALIHAAARAISPALSIIDVIPGEPFWDPTGPFAAERPVDFSGAILKYARSRKSSSPGRAVRPLPSQSDILRCTPSLAALIDRGATAIIALNDWLAHQLFIWCYVAGIDVPGAMSIISFDNDPITKTFPVSTVDFGFARLGYCAARLLCGARLSEADREGNVPGICTIVNHGSVAPAKAGK